MTKCSAPAPIAAFIRALADKMTAPAMNQAQGDDVHPHPKTVWDINCGYCEEFAEELSAHFPGGEIVDLGCLYINDARFQPPGFDKMSPEAQREWIDGADSPCHYAFLYNDRYHDAQNPEGVTDWAQLDLMRYGRGQVTRSEYLRGHGIPDPCAKSDETTVSFPAPLLEPSICEGSRRSLSEHGSLG